MKKLSTKHLLALAVTVQLAAGSAAFAQPFTDISGHWAQQDITWVGERDLMPAAEAGRFHPDTWLSRAEFADIIKGALNLQPVDMPRVRSFEDVVRNHWGFSQIETLQAKDVVEGYPDSMFRPGNPIRRVEVMQVLSQVIQNPEPTGTQQLTLLNTFQDAAAVPGWGRTGVAKVIQYDVFDNSPAREGWIDPERPATRAEVAAMLANMLQNEQLALLGQPDVGVAAVGVAPGPALAATPLASPVTLQTRTTIPANTHLSGTLATGLFSESTRVGDQVMVILDHTMLTEGGEVVLPSGSRVHGVVREVANSNRPWEVAVLDVHFHEVVTPGGLRIPIDAVIASPDGRLFGDTMQGATRLPDSSHAGLRSGMNNRVGGNYGTKQGKELFFDRAINPRSKELISINTVQNEILMGVGDKMTLRFNTPVAVNWLAPATTPAAAVR